MPCWSARIVSTTTKGFPSLARHTASPTRSSASGSLVVLDRARTCLVLLGAGRSLGDRFSARSAPALTAGRATAIAWILRVTAAMLLIGHGAFGFAMRKPECSFRT